MLRNVLPGFRTVVWIRVLLGVITLKKISSVPPAPEHVLASSYTCIPQIGYLLIMLTGGYYIGMFPA